MVRTVTLRRLRYFVAVADARSFTAAAKELHLAQPPLSTQVKLLERELGVELFRRERRTVTLTPAGEALLPEARSILDRYEGVGLIARRAALGEVGRLAIGMVPSAANGPLPRILRAFQEQLPDVELSLSEHRPAELRSELEASRIDVSVHYVMSGISVEPAAETAWATRVIAAEELLVALPVGHRLAALPAITVAELADEPMVLPARHDGEGLYERISARLAEHDIAPPIAQKDVWMLQTIVGLVAAGIGIAIVPESAAVIRAAEVEFKPLAGSVAPVSLVAVWRRDDGNPVVRQFLAIAEQTTLPND